MNSGRKTYASVNYENWYKATRSTVAGVDYSKKTATVGGALSGLFTAGAVLVGLWVAVQGALPLLAQLVK